MASDRRLNPAMSHAAAKACPAMLSSCNVILRFREGGGESACGPSVLGRGTIRALLLYPEFPPSYWSFEGILKLVGRTALVPPLGLITVAALLPQDWDFRLVDCNIHEPDDEDWAWADIVLLTGMIVQRDGMLTLIREAKRRDKTVAVGGPYVTSVPDDARRAGADFLVLDEGEITIPRFLAALEAGETGVTITAEGAKPDMTESPIPRFDLLDLEAYAEISIQYSRGCPFLCEFCDIITLYGRKPRTKTSEQILCELQAIHDLGWRGNLFMVDDNFIGNKKNVKTLLRVLAPWLQEHDYPFSFTTEASVDLAQDSELLELMQASNFICVFLGIETPDVDSLVLTKKKQNTRMPLVEAVDTIAGAGLRVMAGFIIGFDGEKPQADERIVEFIERAAISQAFVSMLQALPNTGLSERLAREGRLVSADDMAGGNQTNLANFVPTRPLREIAYEYVHCFTTLYEPRRYLDRVYRQHLKIRRASRKGQRSQAKVGRGALRAALTVAWRQGIVRPTRFRFWRNLILIAVQNPAVLKSYLGTCAQYEHFGAFREIVRSDIEAQLGAMSNRQLDRVFTPAPPQPRGNAGDLVRQQPRPAA